MERVKNHINYLDILAKSNKQTRNSIIANADKELIYTVCECVINCLNGNINITPETKQKLKRNKQVLRDLVKSRKSSVKKKKEILVQHGGSFLPILLPLVIEAIKSLV
jgi:hypothetical protein